MRICKIIFLFVVALSSVFLLFLIYKQTKNGSEENLYPNSTSEAEREAQLDTFGDRRCEGKIHMNPVPLKLHQRQDTRKNLLSKLCNDSGNLNISGKWRTFDDIPSSELFHLVVDDRHGIIYCYIPKVGCTTWKQIMSVLGESFKVHGVPIQNYEDIPTWNVHSTGPTHLNTYPKAVIKQKMETYKKFLFVRDPFVRLISAYRDKFLKNNMPFYKRFAVPILKSYGNVSNPPGTVEEAHAQGIVPSFSHFIQYLLSLPTENHRAFDEHWQPMVDLCHPCQINYDFIGKMETINEDAVHLLRILKVDNIVNWKRSANKTELQDLETWFSNIPIDWRRKLYEIYKGDFKLFAYENHDTLDYPYPENVN